MGNLIEREGGGIVVDKLRGVVVAVRLILTCKLNQWRLAALIIVLRVVEV